MLMPLIVQNKSPVDTPKVLLVLFPLPKKSTVQAYYPLYHFVHLTFLNTETGIVKIYILQPVNYRAVTKLGKLTELK